MVRAWFSVSWGVMVGVVNSAIAGDEVGIGEEVGVGAEAGVFAFARGESTVMAAAVVVVAV